jgi:hypothetical protein
MEDIIAFNNLNEPLCQAIYLFKEYREDGIRDELPSVQLRTMESNININTSWIKHTTRNVPTKPGRNNRDL